MLQDRLNDAAINLHRVLTQNNVHFGIFGGYAIGVLGGARESKDIDCLASISKPQVVALLNGKDGFTVIPQTRQDYVAFLWSDKPDHSNPVLVEIFCEQFSGNCFSRYHSTYDVNYVLGSRHTMRGIQATVRTVNGQRLGSGLSCFLDPFYLFKGKLRAAATRAKFHDSADLRWLEGRHSTAIQARKTELSLQYIGLAMKRYPELEMLFRSLDVDLAGAQNLTRHLELSKLPAPAPGDVQHGLLG
ncbi:uncharacterized protein N7479_009494 [Penicillium vulpinum]|uniref:uncharacterized protein n=1 Tax=Penicillium vulpinum TaxID=29845 RepID=UPI00254768D1|nr:uncharacterized protein N7479_009494 [Penicillium vulpinum]KAJ5951081.1 hypothetical protein N7479_009494 [Penicillium vulpinum]